MARIVVAKLGLDGHDRGAKIVARIFRDAGYEVIYTGLKQTPEAVASATTQEDADLVGVSLLSGAHSHLVPRLIDRLREAGNSVPVMVGGIIPAADHAALYESGVGAIFGPGASAATMLPAAKSLIAAADESATAKQTPTQDRS